jgi:hypothetical protein
MTDRLHLGPLWGRAEGLVDVCSGYLANPMVQPRATTLPLASTAAWLAGEDPLEAWALAADAAGLRVFAEACDGAVPQALVQSVVEWLDDARWVDPATHLQDWLVAAAASEAPGLEDEVGPWIEQVHREAKLGLDALRLIALVQRGELGMSAIELAFTVGMTWQGVRRSDRTVMGSRCSMQPSLGQRADGTWAFRSESVIENANAIDALVRAALSLLASRSS